MTCPRKGESHDRGREAGDLQGTLHFPLHTLRLFLLYPVWGVIQQFLALGIVVTNLERIEGLRERKAVIVLLGAALFGLVHV